MIRSNCSTRINFDSVDHAQFSEWEDWEPHELLDEMMGHGLQLEHPLAGQFNAWHEKKTSVPAVKLDGKRLQVITKVLTVFKCGTVLRYSSCRSQNII